MEDRELTTQCPNCGEIGRNIISDDELHFICCNCGLVDPYDLLVVERPA